MQKLKARDTGPAVLRLQQALNQRSRARQLPLISEDGDLGPDTASAVQRVGRALGATEETLRQARASGVIGVGLQRIIRWPAGRTPAQLARAAARKRHRPKTTTGPARALAWARQYIGKTEQPPASNTAPWGLTQWQRDLAQWLVGAAWCGTLVGTALRHAGVQDITSRVASVWFILEDALAGRNGFRRVVYRRRTGHGDVTAGQPGDAVGLFSESTHVALIEKRVPGGYQTVEGNTSPGTAGDQANGGGVWRRIRPDSAVAYIVRPNYPKG